MIHRTGKGYIMVLRSVPRRTIIFASIPQVGMAYCSDGYSPNRGMPVPAVPILLAAGALASNGKHNLGMALLVALTGSMLADVVWYEAGLSWHTVSIPFAGFHWKGTPAPPDSKIIMAHLPRCRVKQFRPQTLSICYREFYIQSSRRSMKSDPMYRPVCVFHRFVCVVAA